MSDVDVDDVNININTYCERGRKGEKYSKTLGVQTGMDWLIEESPAIRVFNLRRGLGSEKFLVFSISDISDSIC